MDFWLKNKTAQFGGYWNVPDEKLENELLTYVKEQPCVTLPGLGMLKLSPTDLSEFQAAALAIARIKDVSNPSCAMVSIREAIAFIDEHKNDKFAVPDVRGFDRAMRLQ